MRPSFRGRGSRSCLRPRRNQTNGEECMRRFLLIAGLFVLAVGLLWIGQGTGTVPWPRSSFMVNQLQWAGYGAAMAGFGLVLIWQSNQ
ncbi:hypothetical protein BJA5080_04349 [Bradyrhizobium diazoefficiens SEMIA 5080]|uniref:Uncharacterized protein n=3 Tax=Bradyrhizobium TaxID=374 RepID=A0A837CKN0_9BRAD|nr:hypothetical protein BJA5080_04349 [Bradyrhizobium diazoefficiens SEMIA 5080]